MLQSRFAHKRMRGCRDYAHKHEISRPGAVAREYHRLELAAFAGEPAFLALGWAFNQGLYSLTDRLPVDLTGDALLQGNDLLQSPTLLFFRQRLAPLIGFGAFAG